jgi:lipoyl(octanoyl) transferase
MDSPSRFLLLVEPEAQSGAWNMAVDEALLEAARVENLTAVRFYRWREPTLSLGYFQKSLPENLPSELKSLSRVRRLSGGGAILHHREWTYSCVLPPEHSLASEPLGLYELVHQEIIAVLKSHQIPAELRGTSAADKAAEPFLCFGRKDSRDIVLGTHKILGSAQRRRRGAVLQHGSLLLYRSPFAPMYPGLCDLLEDKPPIEEWIPLVAARIAGYVRGHREGSDDVADVATELPAEIIETVQVLERDKYRLLDWR